MLSSSVIKNWPEAAQRNFHLLFPVFFSQAVFKNTSALLVMVSFTFTVSFNLALRDVFSPILVSYFGEVTLTEDLKSSFKTRNGFPFH